MQILDEYVVEIPEYALSYLINSDASGLEDQEIKYIDQFMQSYYDEASDLHAHVILSPTKDEGSFNRFPVFGLACTTVPCKILIYQ